MKTGALLLAAGFSRRFGGVKLQARLPSGKTVLQQTLERLSAATPHIIMITRQPLLDDHLHPAVPGLESMVQIVLCDEARLGMGHSLSCGAHALAAFDAALVCLADMPHVTTDSYRRLLDALHPERILIPTRNGRPGNPVGFGRRFFPELARCQGDEGARGVIRQHQRDCVTLPLDDAGIHRDIDVPSDLVLDTCRVD